MKISALLNETRSTELPLVVQDVDLGVLNVTYSPGKYTPETEDRLQSAIETARPSRGIAEVLVDILHSWDLIGEDVQWGARLNK